MRHTADNSQKKDAPHYICNVVASSRFADPVELRAFITVKRDFAALAPVNEQLHSAEDPWVYYIEGVLDGLKGPKMLHK